MSEENYYAGFPTLQAKQNELDNNVAALRKKMSEVKTTERYSANEPERKYQLGKLEEEMEETLTKAQADFDIELQAIESDIAEQAFAPISGDESTLSDARQTVEGITSQMLISTAPADVLPLLAMRSNTLNDVEKNMLARELPKIAEYASGRSRNNAESRDIANYIDRIQDACSDTSRGRDLNEQRQLLDKIKQYGSNITTIHTTTSNISKEFNKDDSQVIGRDFYENYVKGNK